MATIVVQGETKEELAEHTKRRPPYLAQWKCLECGCRFKVEPGDIIYSKRDSSWHGQWHAECPNPACDSQVIFQWPANNVPLWPLCTFSALCALIILAGVVYFVAVLL
jgi:hypothetical protein